MSLFMNKLVLSCILFISGVTGCILVYKPTVATAIVGVTVAMAIVSATMVICHLRRNRK